MGHPQYKFFLEDKVVGKTGSNIKCDQGHVYHGMAYCIGITMGEHQLVRSGFFKKRTE